MPSASLPIVSAWRRDETIYSWCGAFHRATGSGSAKRTSQQLFGVVHAPRMVDVPTGLAHFCEQTGGLLGSASQILESRTVFPYLARFAPQLVRDRAAADTPGQQGFRSPKTHLGLKGSSWGSTLMLRACAKCAAESRSEFGIPIWRISHQLPMTLICTEHGEPLVLYSAHAGVWSLPDDAGPGHLAVFRTGAELDAAKGLSALDAEMLHCSVVVDQQGFRHATIQALEHVGIVKAHLRLDTGTVANFLRSSDTWRVITANLKSPADDIGCHLEALLRDRVRSHPFAWVLLWGAIAEANPVALHWFRCALQGKGSNWEQLKLDLNETGRRSYRPRSLLETLLRSSTLKEAALELRVSGATLRRWLNLDPALRAQWSRRRSAERSRLAVAGIRAFLRDHPRSNRTELLRRCKTDVAWLQANDPQQLRSLLDTIPSSRSAQLALWTPDTMHCRLERQQPVVVGAERTLPEHKAS